VLADAGKEDIQLRAALRIIERGRCEQTVGELATQTVTMRHVELLFAAAPDEIEAALNHLLCDGIGE
jgi:hypothetical protein